MSKVIILGSANAIPDEQHDNTHMVVVSDKRVVLIDCVSNPLARLKHARVPVEGLTDLVLTHFHPDHISGVPLLLMDLCLLGRKEPLNVYGLAYTLDRVEKMMELYNWESWPNFFEVIFHRLPEQAMQVLIDDADLRVLASLVRHLIPTIGVRIDFPMAE
jgi:ribonuclease Z